MMNVEEYKDKGEMSKCFKFEPMTEKEKADKPVPFNPMIVCVLPYLSLF